MRGEMVYKKRDKVYRSANVEFNPETMEGTSYGWWHFVRKINGLVVFNNYQYSNTTRRHQNKMRSLLAKLNIKIDLIVSTPMSFGQSGNEINALEDAIRCNNIELKIIENSLNNPRRKKALDDDRKGQIQRIKDHNAAILRVIKPLPLDRALHEMN